MASTRTVGLWARVDERRARRRPAGRAPRADRRFRWVADAMLPLALTVTAAVTVLLPKELPNDARLSLFSFALAVILWSTTRLNAAYVALAAVMLLVLSGGSS